MSDAVFIKNNITSRDAGTLQMQLDMLEKLDAVIRADHNGVIMYHFARPDPVNDPYRMQYIEVYGTVRSFVDHLSPFAMELLNKTLAKENLSKFEKGIYGVDLDKRPEVIDALRPFGVEEMPNIKRGYILHPSAIFKDALSDQKPVFADFIFYSNEKEEVYKEIDKIVKAADADIFTLAAVESKDGSAIELTEVCGSNEAIANHLRKQQTQDAFENIATLCEKSICNIYGEMNEITHDLIGSLGYDVTRIATDWGYILHPDADPQGK